MTLTLPATNGKTMSRSGHQRLWMIDAGAMEWAIAWMGITLPVVIRFTGGIHRHGTAYFKQGQHYICVSSMWSGERASETLWHELQHCVQRETWAREHWHEYIEHVGTNGGASFTRSNESAFVYACRQEHFEQYQPQNRRYGYQNNPQEVDARTVAATMNVQQKLTRFHRDAPLTLPALVGSMSKEDINMAAKTTTTKRTTATKTTTTKVTTKRHIDVIADVITKLGGKAKVADIAEYVEKHKSLPSLGEYTYRTVYGIITRDKGKTLAKVSPGVFKVKGTTTKAAAKKSTTKSLERLLP